MGNSKLITATVAITIFIFLDSNHQPAIPKLLKSKLLHRIFIITTSIKRLGIIVTTSFAYGL